MNNKLILRLIKNNIDEIRDLIIHFQDEEDDLKSVFPSLESRLNSLNKDIDVLKSNLSQHPYETSSVEDPIKLKKQPIPPIQEKEEEVIALEVIEEILEEEVTEARPLIKEQENKNESLISEEDQGKDEEDRDTKEESIKKIDPIFSTLNDKLHESSGHNLQEKIKKSKLDDIQSAIGINDQFLFIRELFENKSEAYRSAINYINSEDDYTKIVSYFNTSQKWDSEDVNVIQFYDLIKRKFE
ncbi:hypothetical protein [Ancylomarina sp. 16SWW S1-10-2]|uniref:hypothetical protein n=1 Tax=Ancylomarina sp. 16SWW S1-10-2 TaxID=2499681 RepID=UPI0012ADCF85|nr:hypothetical protein [Ancylomarina sp. 16SWW S1-10-2]MRT94538.1 hypothetical protein [Ancylomarina sp. 16SWW S1-10-2]